MSTKLRGSLISGKRGLQGKREAISQERKRGRRDKQGELERESIKFVKAAMKAPYFLSTPIPSCIYVSEIKGTKLALHVQRLGLFSMRNNSQIVK